MRAVESEVFRSGDRIAVSLPEEWAAELGTHVSIVRDGPGVTIQPLHTREDNLRNNRALAAELRAVWAGVERPASELRDPDIFPDRPGLY